MFKKLPRRKRWLRRQLVVARERERRNFARKDRHYHTGVVTDAILNARFKGSKPLGGNKIVRAPTHLDLNDHLNETLSFLDEVRNECLFGDAATVLVDISAVIEISPSAALSLLAEVLRSLSYKDPSRRVRGNYPKGERASKMLGDIGFYRAFQIPTPDIRLPSDSRIYFRAVYGNSSDGKLAAPLMKMFEHVGSMNPLASKKLYGALIECMDNVKAHAYPSALSPRPDLVGEWWMAGFADPAKGQLAFVFLDQGAGIPTTIKDKRSVRFQSYISFPDARILGKAVMDGLSRKQSKRRGNGLPSLRELIDVAPQGFLRVIANRGEFVYKKGHPTIGRTLKHSVEGSIIIWSIQNKSSETLDREATDLMSRSNSQMEIQYGQ